MSDYDYILNPTRDHKNMSERLAILEEMFRDVERDIGMLECEYDRLRGLVSGLGNRDEAEKDGKDNFEHNYWMEEEKEHPTEVVLTQNPYVECKDRRIKGETWSCRADDGRYSSPTSSLRFYEHQRRTPTTKSDSETTRVADKTFERSNAPSPDENRHREWWWEAAREQERGSLRQIQTEMAILDLVARVEKLKELSVSETGNASNGIRLRGGKGVCNECGDFICNFDGYTKWNEADAKSAADAQETASKENPKVTIADDGGRTATPASAHRPYHQARSQAGDAEKLTPKVRSGSGEDIKQAIQRPASVNLGLEEKFNSISGCLGQESMLSFLAVSPPANGYTDASIALATVLQTRNYFLERELHAFKEMNDSLVQDRNWQMSMQAELEEKLEAVQTDRDDIFGELESLRKRWKVLVEGCGEPASHKREWGKCNEDIRFSGVRMRGGGEESGLDLTEVRKREDKVPLDEPEPSPISSESSDYASEYCASFQSSPGLITTNFDFFPRESTIIFGGDSPHIYQFPRKFTLPQICELLESKNAKEKTKDDVYVSHILEIMKIREDMGLKLPDNLCEDRVSIGLPNVPTRVHLDNNLNIAAWQTVDTDVKNLGKSLQRINISSSAVAGAKENSLDTSSSDERDTYQDIGGLFDSANEPCTDLNEEENGFASFCACTSCTKDGRETYFNICDMQPSPTVRVRGGGDEIFENYTTFSCSSGSPHLSPLLSSSLSPIPRVRLMEPCRYGNVDFALDTVDTSNNYEAANIKGPLSTHLANLLFPPSLAQEREDSIRRFNWRNVKRMNPQFKNKCSRGFRYRKNPMCEDWVSQIDKHREYCDYCQAVFIEEERLRQKEGVLEDIRHEYDAPIPNSGKTRLWGRIALPDDFYNVSSPAVQVPDSRLRGGASHEYEMECERKDIEDWRREWHDLATVAQGTSCMSRTYRNSSSLSTKTQIQPMEPVIRDFGSRWKVREEYGLDTEDDYPHNGCGGTIDQGCLGESAQFLHDYHHHTLNSDNLLSSRTKNPKLLLLRSPRGGSIGQGVSQRPLVLRFPPRVSSLNQSARVSDLIVEDWLENPRSAPLPALSEESLVCKPTLRVHWHPDLSSLDEQTHGMLHISPPPSPSLSRLNPCKSCSQVLALLLATITKLKQRMRLRKQAPKASNTTPNSRLPRAPTYAQTNFRTVHINKSVTLPSSSLKIDKSLPPTPHASILNIESYEFPLILREKFPADSPSPDQEPPEDEKSSKVKLLERASAIAKVKDDKHVEIVCNKGTEWWVPTIAGPVDLVREALMWLIWEEEERMKGLDRCS